MTIKFQCQSCSAAYSVKDSMAHKRGKCKKCGQVMTIPAAPEEPVVVAEVIDEPGPSLADFAREQAEQEVLAQDHRIGNTLASNPGRVKVNPFRYAYAYPTWFLVWHLGLLISILLCFVSLIFVLAVIFFGVFCYFFWARLGIHFKSGCANPAMVVSIDPPLVAAYTNLTKGRVDAEIVKISAEPLSRFSTGKPSPGQRIPTIALYNDHFCTSEHWSTFYPKPVNLVTGNRSVIDRVLASFDNDGWKKLSQGLAQIPKPYSPGHYRIYQPQEFQPRPRPEGDQIKQVVMNALGQLENVLLFQNMTTESLQAVSTFVPSQASNCIWGIIEGSSVGKGFVFTDKGIFYNNTVAGSGHLAYADIAGALSTVDGLEIMLKKGQHGKRVYFGRDAFSNDIFAVIDTVLDTIAGRRF